MPAAVDNWETLGNDYETRAGVLGYYALCIGLPVAGLVGAAAITDGSVWGVVVVVASCVVGGGTAATLRRFDHHRLPAWVAPAGIALAIIATSAASLPDPVLAAFVSFSAGLVFVGLLFARRRRREFSTPNVR